jgi:hypothetical protein
VARTISKRPIGSHDEPTELLLALLVAPFARFVYRPAKVSGSRSAWNVEHESGRSCRALRLLLFLSFLGHANAWPRAWAVFGVINAAPLLFGAIGAIAARLWRLRRRGPKPPTSAVEGAPTREPGGEAAGLIRGLRR